MITSELIEAARKVYTDPEDFKDAMTCVDCTNVLRSLEWLIADTAVGLVDARQDPDSIPGREALCWNDFTDEVTLYRLLCKHQRELEEREQQVNFMLVNLARHGVTMQ